MPDPATAGSADPNFLLVVYELSAAAGDDEAAGLVSELRAFDGHPLTATAWLLKTPRSAAHVLDTLARRLGPADRLVVVEAARVGWCNVEAGPELFAELIRRSGTIRESG